MASQADRLNEHCKGFPHVHKKHWVHDSVALMAVFVDPRWAATYPVALAADLDLDRVANFCIRQLGDGRCIREVRDD